MATSSPAIAVIGAGISGMSCAAALHDNGHDVALYEQRATFGGHANTQIAAINGVDIPVDTGFIVYNEVNYPNLTALFARLNVPTIASDMSFSASIDNGTFEYASTGLRGLFAQPTNLLSPKHWRFLKEITRFFRDGKAALQNPEITSQTLGSFIQQQGYSDAFVRGYLLPLGAAIWSTPESAMLEFPLATILRFFNNHRLLDATNQVTWRTVKGGSREYVQRLLATLIQAGRAYSNKQVIRIVRTPASITVHFADGSHIQPQQLVLAGHSDTMLELLTQPSSAEQQTIGAIRYKSNHVVLHSDTQWMPKRRAAWASWNYRGSYRENGYPHDVSLTYWMNRLQGIPKQYPLFVTVNPTTPPAAIHGEYTYEHPQYTLEAFTAQQAIAGLQGTHNTWWCGAYCGYGFHEDGITAGLKVAHALQEKMAINPARCAI